jgi:hypothetical protein
MAEKSTAQAAYLPGQDPAAIEANRKYQEALERLTQTLEARKNEVFDPTWLAAAKGFLAPTRTGNFFEALGNVAGNVGAAQNEEQKREQDIAQAQLGAAGQGIALQRQKMQDKQFDDYLAGKLQTSGGISAAAPAAAPAGGFSSLGAAPSAGAPAGATAGAPAGALTQAVSPYVAGTQVAPENPNRMTQQEYVAMNRFSGKPLPDLLKEGAEIESKNIHVQPKGVFDARTGKFHSFETGERVKRPIPGLRGTYDINVNQSAVLDRMIESKDPRLPEFIKTITGQGIEGSSAQSVEEREAEARGEQKRQETLGQKSGEKEASVQETYSNAQRIYGNASRVLNYIEESKEFMGLLNRPTVISAIGKLFNEGIKTPGGSISAAGLEDALLQSMPGAKQKDIDNIKLIAAEIAELNLAFTQTWLTKQGTVTEGERKIVGAVSGNVSSSPQVLKARMDLLKMRSQYDIDVADAFMTWQEKNPNGSYLKFERSGLFKDLKKNYEEQTSNYFNTMPAIPSRQRAAPAGDLSNARKRVDELLGQKR